jgi:hypothetical protein
VADGARCRPSIGAIFWVLLGVAASLPSLGQALKVTTSLDRTRLRLGENLVFTLRIEAPNLAIPQPALPPIPGFRSVGKYQTIDKTGMGRALAFHYLLAPTESGRLAVPPFALRIGDETVTVPGFTVEVETSAPPAASPKPVPAALGDDVFLAATLSPDHAFTGQPVTYTLHLFTRRSVRGLDVVKTPDFKGFRKVEDAAATKSPTRQVNRDGRIFLDAVVIRATLFPLQPGQLDIGPYSTELKLEPNGHGGPLRVTVVGGQARLNVTPLPPAPPDFKGAVGSFNLSVAQGAPPKADLGQPFQWAILVEGSGFLPEDPIVWPSTPFFSPYPATTEDTSGFLGGQYQIHRLITMPLLPKLAGDASLPPARLVYFDPSSKNYKTLEAGGARITVAGGEISPGVNVVLAPLVSAPKPGPKMAAPLSKELFLALLFLPFIANLLLAGGQWVYRSFLMAPEKARLRALRRQTARMLSRAHRHMDVRKADDFHGELLRALIAAMDIRTGRSTGGLTRAQLEAALSASDLESGQIHRALDLMDQLESARYTPDRPTRHDLQQRYRAVADWTEGRGGWA